MEHRKRSLTSVLDNKDTDTNITVINNTVSIDSQFEDYTNFMYNGTFNLFKTICNGFINLICSCCYNKY